MNKTELRTAMLNQRMRIPEMVHVGLSQEAAKRIQDHPFYKQAKHIGIYHPIKNEMNLLSLKKDQEKIFYLPKVYDHEMHYLKYEEVLKESELGIYEPVSLDIYDDQLDLVIVPALAVDKKYHRVGYGKGFFDRFIRAHKHIKTLGVVMSFQVIEYMTHSYLDEPLHDIIVIPYQGEE